MMMLNIAILICEILGIFSINRFMSRRKVLIESLLISFLLFVLGLFLRHRIPWLDYRLLIVPFIQIVLLSICHLTFQKFFNIPFYLNIRGNEFPNDLKTETNGFTVFLSSLLSLFILMTSLITFFILK